MNLHDWIDELCDELDVDLDFDEALVLDVARDAAHNVDRPAAPLTTFLLGYAAARSGGDPETLERLAVAATDLALRWDKPADAVVEVEDLEVDVEIDPGVEDELEPLEA
ncbi:MAG: hypothetical protein JWP74_1646 [Marmoricola sp.]|nr:hypothetical protein [Marmoricola sp.]